MSKHAHKPVPIEEQPPQLSDHSSVFKDFAKSLSGSKDKIE